MKQNIFKFTAIMLLALCAVSCNDDFLEKSPLDEYSNDAVWESQALAEAAVLDLYAGTWAGTLTREETTDTFTDQAVFTHPGRGVDGYTEGKMNSAGSYIDFQWMGWKQMYSFIRSSNIAIARLEENVAGFDDVTLTRLKGDAYYMRAYFYSQLMRQWGGVILTTSPFELEEEIGSARGTFEETINLIISDLNQAITLLEDAPMSKARAHKVTALALKSRVLTHAASDLYEPSKVSGISLLAGYDHPELIGWTSGSQSSRWEAAKTASKQLLDATTGYKLNYAAPAPMEEAIQNYEDIWLQGDKNQDFIWGRLVEEFGFSSRTYAGGDGWNQGPGMVALAQGPNGYHEWAGTTPTEALISKYDLADGTKFDWDNPVHAAAPYEGREARFYATILYDGAPWKERTDDVVKFDNFNEIQTGYYTLLDGTTINGVDTRQGPIEDWNGSRTGYYFRKFADPNTPASWPSNLQKIDAPYIRYSEILLNYVEANINLGDDAEALIYLNKLRFRNGLPTLVATGSALLENYKRDRDKELVQEDARLYDMKRWLEGPYSLDKQVQQILITATQKPGTTVANYRKDVSSFDYTYKPTDIVFENRLWQDHVYFMPIKQTEIDSDPTIFQNPGY